MELETSWMAPRTAVARPSIPANSPLPRPTSRLCPPSMVWRAPCGCGSSMCLSYLPWEEGNTFRLCYPIYATPGCCVTGIDSHGGEVQDGHRTWSTSLRTRIIDTEHHSGVTHSRAFYRISDSKLRENCLRMHTLSAML